MSSFLQNFRTLTSCSEVHPTNAIWAGLVTLSAAVGGKVSVDMGHFNIRPHLYTIFVAAPGQRKSTAMDFSGRMLEDLGHFITFDATTKESLVTLMTQCETTFTPRTGGLPYVYTPITLLATEMSDFIGPSKEGMISFLTTVFDKRGDYANLTIKRGKETIKKPYLVLLGCTTPAWITARLRDDVISGGFSSRTIFVHETERADRIAFPEVNAEHKAAWDACVAYARNHLAYVGGLFRWDDEARSFYKHWYETQTVPRNPYIAGFCERKHVHALKVAQLISLSETPDMVLRRQHIEFAIELLNMVESNLPRVFAGVGRFESSGENRALLDFVKAAGGALSEKSAYSVMLAKYPDYQIKQMIEQLVDTEKLLRRNVVSAANVPILTLFTPEGLVKRTRELEYQQQHQLQ